MRKLILIFIISLFLFSCKVEVKPIEKYYNHDYVVVDKNDLGNWVQFKNKDTIFRVYLIPFDMKNLKIGDTIR